MNFDLISSPDLAQTIAVTCLGLRVDCRLTGLHTLLIKETNRLVALKNEIKKLGIPFGFNLKMDLLILKNYFHLYY